MACAICQTRRPRRFCPGVGGDICTLCCGAEREVSIDCPLDCEYLREAHKREKSQFPTANDLLPNSDLRVSRTVIEENYEYLDFLSRTLGKVAVRNPKIVDYDIREALEALVRTYRTLQSGLVYESVPQNPLAAGICLAIDSAIEEFRRAEAKRLGIHKNRDRITLGFLVFLQHFEISYNNGRRRGRAFLDALLYYYSVGTKPDAAGASPLILL